MRWVVAGALVVTLGLVVVLLATRREDEPKIFRDTPTHFVPLAGNVPFDQIEQDNPNCLVPTLTVIRAMTNWTLRLDDRRSITHNIDGEPYRDGTVELSAAGATWRDSIAEATRTPLPAELAAAILAALNDSCVDENPEGDPDDAPMRDTRWFELGYGDVQRARDVDQAAKRIPEASAITRKLAVLFDRARAFHVSSQLARARKAVLAIAKPKPFTIDLGKPTVTDADAVTILDWALEQPATYEAGGHSLSGTFTVDGKPRPIAISLDWDTHSWPIWGVGPMAAFDDVRAAAAK